MKKLFLLGFIVLISILNTSFTLQRTDSCNVEMALKACKEALLPYTFQDRKTITFDYLSESQSMEYEIQLFKGEIYRFVFNKAFAPGVEFEIYNKPMSSNRRKLIYDSRTQASDGDLLIYHPETVPYLYIDVIIPKKNARQYNGCTTIMIGYELTFVN